MITNAQRFIQRMYPSARATRVLDSVAPQRWHTEVRITQGPEKTVLTIGVGETDGEAWREAYGWHKRNGAWK